MNDTLLMPEGFPKTKNRLEILGLSIIELDVSEAGILRMLGMFARFTRKMLAHFKIRFAVSGSNYHERGLSQKVITTLLKSGKV